MGGVTGIEEIIAELKIPSARWCKPTLIAIFGVPGAGKSEIARYLAAHHPLCNLSTDALRLRYGFESGITTRQVMDQIAARLLPQYISVIFDGIHLARKDRQIVQELATKYQADARLVYVVAEPATIKQRLQARMQRPDGVAAEGKFVITPEHFARIVSYLEPPTPNEEVIVVDTTTNSLDEQLVLFNRQLQRNFRGE
jgi:predicted kinase